MSETALITFTLAGLCVTPTPWDKDGNLAKLEEAAGRAEAMGAQVVVAPEGFLEGYVWNDDDPQVVTRERYFDLGEAFDGPFMSRVAELAAKLKIYLSVGYAERRGDEMFNSSIFYSPQGALLGRYSKAHTAGNDEPFNSKGSEFPVVDTPLGRFGTVICMDRQLPETTRILSIKGAHVILIPSWGGYGEMNDVMMRTRAYENGVYVAFVHPRRCLVVGPDGAVIAQDTGLPGEVVMAQITPRPNWDDSPIKQRRPEIYGELVTPVD